MLQQTHFLPRCDVAFHESLQLMHEYGPKQIQQISSSRIACPLAGPKKCAARGVPRCAMRVQLASQKSRLRWPLEIGISTEILPDSERYIQLSFPPTTSTRHLYPLRRSTSRRLVWLERTKLTRETYTSIDLSPLCVKQSLQESLPLTL
jgi:hypothetical protein